MTTTSNIREFDYADTAVDGLAESKKKYLDTIIQIHNVLEERLTLATKATTTTAAKPLSHTDRHDQGSKFAHMPETGVPDRRSVLAFYNLSESDTDEDGLFCVQQHLQAEHHSDDGFLTYMRDFS